MTRSALIELLAKKLPHLSEQDVEMAVKRMLEEMSQSLSQGRRIEIRGFGCFTLHMRKSFMGRNPKTGESVAVPAQYVSHFKPGKQLRDRVAEGFQQKIPIKNP